MTARQAALAALERCRRDGAYSEAALDSAIRRAELDSRDAALAQRLCLGVLQNAALCDFYIDAYASMPTARMEPKVRDVLRLGVYQLVFLDRVPVSAAVNESVELAKTAGKGRAAGMVNAVLRRVAEHRANLPEIPGEGAAYLAVRYSHPLWLCQMLCEAYGTEFTESFFAANNGVPPTHIQVNTRRITPAALTERLARHGVAAQSFGALEDCLVLTGGGDPAQMEEFSEGLFYVQDAGARLAVTAADPKPGMTVLDACAAPGGKSFAAAIAMGDAGHILARDIHENKLVRVRASAQRLGLSCITACTADARDGAPEQYDLVLADVPCSGLGVIWRKPDIRSKPEESLRGLPAVQGEILHALAGAVKPGGILLYSTCTILQRENEAVTDAFLSEHPEFTMERFTLPDVGPVPGCVTLWPHIHGTDGFYICKMRRQA